MCVVTRQICLCCSLWSIQQTGQEISAESATQAEQLGFLGCNILHQLALTALIHIIMTELAFTEQLDLRVD